MVFSRLIGEWSKGSLTKQKLLEKRNRQDFVRTLVSFLSGASDSPSSIAHSLVPPQALANRFDAAFPGLHFHRLSPMLSVYCAGFLFRRNGMYLPGMRPWTTYLVLVIFLALGGSLRQLDGSFRVGAGVLAADAAPHQGGRPLGHSAHRPGPSLPYRRWVHRSSYRVPGVADPLPGYRHRRCLGHAEIGPKGQGSAGPPKARLGVDDWWRSATPERRADFLKAIDSGQMAVAAMAMNNTAFLNGRQWQKMLHWLPEDLWQRVQPSVAMQDDVNGIPRAGAIALLDRGIHRLLTGMNEPGFLPPLRRPSAIWWKMPDGRRLFVYLGYCYPFGHFFFDPVEWRRGPSPHAGETRYRPPRAGDFLGSDEASVRKAHRHLLGRLRTLEAEGYRHPTLLLPITNQWRMDNDPPFLPLADFVATWKRLELKPTLRLTTAAAAMKRLEEEMGAEASGICRGMARLVVFRHRLCAARSGGKPRRQAADRCRRFAALGAVECQRPPHRGRIAPRPLPLRRAYLGSGRQHGVALQSGHAGAIQRKGDPRVPAHGAGRMAPGPTRSQPFGQRTGRAVRGQHRTAALERMDSNATQCLEGGRPFVGRRQVGRPKEDVSWTAVSAPFRLPKDSSELSRENPDATFLDNAPRSDCQVLGRTVAGARACGGCKLSTTDRRRRSLGNPAPKIAMDAQGWPTAVTWPGMTQAALPARSGRFRGDPRQGCCPAHGDAVLGNRPSLPSGRSSAARSSKRPMPRPGKGEGRRQSSYGGLHADSCSILD